MNNIFALPLFVSAAGLRFSLSNQIAYSSLAFRAAFISAAMLGSLAIPAVSRAGVVLALAESGSDVVGTLSGSITSLSGATFDQTRSTLLQTWVRSDIILLQWTDTQGGNANLDYYLFSTVPANLGTSSNVLSTASSSTGVSGLTNFTISSRGPAGAVPQFGIQQGYTLGTAVSGTLTWSNTSLSSMGIAPGSYVFSWPGDSVTINAVPEPSTCAMSLAGLACGGYSMFRRRKRA